MTTRTNSETTRPRTNPHRRSSAKALTEGDTWRATIASHPDQIDIRALTMTVYCDEVVEYRKNPAEAVRPALKRKVRQLIRAAISAECRSGVSTRSVRLAVGHCEVFIRALVARHGLRADAAATWLGVALETFAAAASEWFQREHAKRLPAARMRLLRRLNADRGRDVFVLAELRAGDDATAERSARMIEPILNGNPHVFAGFTASTPGRPACALTLDAVAHEVHLMGTDAARCGINFLPPDNGAFFPGTHVAQNGVVSAGVADAELLAAAIRDARSAGKSDAAVEEAFVNMHAAVLRISGELGQTIAAHCGLRWAGISPVTAPVNCTIHGASPQWRSSWAVLEELHGSPVESVNILRATAHLNACLWRAAQQSGQKICGFIGSFNPPAEDGLLAQRVREGRITVRDLVLQETVCSSGVDMAIARSDTTVMQIAALYGEVASLSDQWSKPLTVRVIVPPRGARYTANGDVFLGGLLGSGPPMELLSSSGAAMHVVQTVGHLQRSAQ